MGYVSVRSRRFKWSGLSSALRASACGASHMIELWLIIAAIGLGVRHLTVSPSKYTGHEGRWGAWGDQSARRRWSMDVYLVVVSVPQQTVAAPRCAHR